MADDDLWGGVLRWLRSQRSYSDGSDQGRTATALGLSQTMLSRMERGATPITLDAMLRMRDLLWPINWYTMEELERGVELLRRAPSTWRERGWSGDYRLREALRPLQRSTPPVNYVPRHLRGKRIEVESAATGACRAEGDVEDVDAEDDGYGDEE
jgi:transcriptional regulator with XRE-family HTH domain